MPSAAPVHFDVIVIGAGAAGLMCALRAGQRGRRVLVVDHANKVGKKILMSGGGRCNFTNLHCGPDNFISANPHFAKSALSRYTPFDFIALVEKHGIAYHEKKLGQLFCDNSSKDVVRMLLAECDDAGVEVRTHTAVTLDQPGPPHVLHSANGTLRSESLVIATGGYSIPSLGASGFGYDLARTLGLRVLPTRAGLVPVTLPDRMRRQLDGLSGVSLDVEATAGGMAFRENLLFTHRGLSGPAILQASSYWQAGEALRIDLLPGTDPTDAILSARHHRPRTELKTWLAELLTRRVAQRWCERWLNNKPLADLSSKDLEDISQRLKAWAVYPDGTEGYRTAEVTLGGVDTAGLSSRTMECRQHPGLYFIGEVVDVTGHLGGHNFQWAWASGQAAGEHV